MQSAPRSPFLTKPSTGQALDLAGTYGVLSLFGVLPAAAVWSQRSSNTQFSGYKVIAR